MNGWSNGVILDSKDSAMVSNSENGIVPMPPKRSFYDYQYRDGPDYKIRFDKMSG